MSGSKVLPIELLGWGEEKFRDLPWRKTRDPWAILVSEVMLQQTQVQRVLEYWECFMNRFPNVEACAESAPAKVIKEWAGLGFNRRAVNLHRCSVRIVEDHNGCIPDCLEKLLDLPGIGQYTARAILAFAFERDIGVLDTNTGRVLARWAGENLKRGCAQEMADRSVPKGMGWIWNQTLLDFGALICQPKNPACCTCPLVGSCSWKGLGADPAIKSAGVAGSQSRFEGSDREGRGKLIRLLCENPIPATRLAELVGWPDEPKRARKVANSLIEEGLIEISDDFYHLPSEIT